MTKYDEICAAFRQSTIDGLAYRDRSHKFASRVLQGFVSYLGAPPERVRCFVDPDETADSNTAFLGMTLGEDGWWVAYMRLILSQGQGVYPELPVRFKFSFLVESDKFTVRVGDSDRTHTVLESADATLEPIYQQAYDLVLRYFTLGLRRFLDEAIKTAPRNIGFAAGMNLDE